MTMSGIEQATLSDVDRRKLLNALTIIANADIAEHSKWTCS